jgi:hypothetical protein
MTSLVNYNPDKQQSLLLLCDLALQRSTNHAQLSEALGRVCVALCKISGCRTSAAYSWIHGNKLSYTEALNKMKAIRGRCRCPGPTRTS